MFVSDYFSLYINMNKLVFVIKLLIITDAKIVQSVKLILIRN